MNHENREHATASQKVDTMALLKSDDLRSIPVLWKVYKDLTIKRKNAQVDAWVSEQVKKVKTTYPGDAWRADPLFTGYVALHDRFTDKKGLPSSCEVLIDFIFRKDSVPRINTFVDIYNAISAVTGVSIGAHDVDKLAGNPKLEILARDTAFVPIAAKAESVAKKGEYGYLDEDGPICRMDIRQCERTKITEKTKHVFVIFQGHESIDEALLRQSIHMLDEVVPMLRPSRP